jgi:hypothetical protein
MFHFFTASLALPLLLGASGFLCGCCVAITMARRLDRALEFVQSWHFFKITDFSISFSLCFLK